MNPSDPAASRTSIFYALAGCLALHFTAITLLFPVYAKKIGAFGSGVAVFGLSTTVFSLTALLAVPYMGLLADRLGRRLVLLFALASYALSALMYLLAPTGGAFIAARALAGALTAGLIPAYTSMIADITPAHTRGRWIGFVNGWSAIGFVIGPPLGGWLFERWGLSAPFLTAAFLDLTALFIALALVPETIHRATAAPADQTTPITAPSTPTAPQKTRFWSGLPQPHGVFVMLLLVTFFAVFSWRFVEPQFHFYIYDYLGWSSARFGLTMSGYAVLLMLAETLLGRLSDRFGRKPVLMLGLLVHCAQYFTLVTTDQFTPIALGIAISGLGEGLFMPALNAYYLDIAPEAHRGRTIGYKEAAFTLAGLVGPALVVLAVRVLTPQGVFMISGGLVLLSALLIPLMHRKDQPVGAKFSQAP